MERRKEIVTAVLHIIGRTGFNSLSAQTIANEVGMTSGALFRHFTSLQRINEEVVRYAVAELEGTFPDESLQPLERLLELAGNRIQLLGSNCGLAWLLRSEQAYLILPKTSCELLREITRRSRQYLIKAIRDGALQGSIRNDIEPEILVVPVMGTIHALIGMPGVHKQAVAEHIIKPNEVLSALKRMIEAPL